MKPGITLIDTMVALAIGSILSLMLYGSLAQTNRMVRFVDALTGVTTDFLFALDRLSKDTQGAFIPIEGQKQKSSSEDAKAANPEKEGEESKTPEKETSQKQKKERLGDVFVVNDLAKGVRSTKLLMTCITSNPLVVYGEATPRVVRVVYMLQPSTEDSNLYELLRYESSELTLKTFQERQAKKSIVGYPLLSRIRQIGLTLIARKEESEEEKKQKQKKEEAVLKDKKAQEAKQKKERPPIQWERFSHWSDEERLKEKKSMLPESIQVKGVALDERKREVPFEWIVPIAAAKALPTEIPEPVKAAQESSSQGKNAKQEESKNTQPASRSALEIKKG